MKFDFDTVSLSAITLIIILGLFNVFKALTATGKVEYCYIQSEYSTHADIKLKGFIPWRQDLLIGNFTNHDDAMKFASKVHCKLWSIK